MCTETVIFSHSGANSNPEWFKVATAEHENVEIATQYDQEDLHVFIGDTAPNSSDTFFPWAGNVFQGSNKVVLRVSDARESIWLRLNANRNAVVIRGSAKVNF